jgi:hypothetical protein
LSERWITERLNEWPELCDFPLGRWFRMPIATPGVELVEHLLEILENEPLIADRRRRLRSDAIGFEETRMELLVAAWLRTNEQPFRFTRTGPDLEVRLTDTSTLLMEVTAPRKTALWHDLFERLTLLASRFGVEIRIDSGGEEVLAGENRVPNSRHVIEEIIAALGTNERKQRRPLRWTFSDIGVEIQVKPSRNPGAFHASTAGSITSYTAFEYVVDAANAKARQMPTDRANALLIGTSRIPSMIWSRFSDQLRGNLGFYPSLKWECVPQHVKYVVLFSPSLVSIQPHIPAIFLTNLASQFTDLDGIDEFAKRLFPSDLVDPNFKPFFQRPY